MATSYTSTDKKEKRPPEVVFKTMSCINGIRNGIIEMKSYILILPKPNYYVITIKMSVSFYSKPIPSIIETKVILIKIYSLPTGRIIGEFSKENSSVCSGWNIVHIAFQGECLCDNWKSSFLPFLYFDWRTFSRRVTARWWRHSANNQVSTN